MSGNILSTWFKPFSEQITATARLMVGVPDYDAYVTHVRQSHPEQTPLDYTSFFRARQEARYGGGQSRCC